MKGISRKLISITFLVGICVLLLETKVQAATAEIELKANQQKVNQGESFEVSINASSEQGLNGVMLEVEYDEEKLEIERKEAGTNWIDLSGEESNKIELMYNSETDIQKGEVYKITFKAKEEVEGTGEIKIKSIEIDTMESGNNSTVKIDGDKSVEIEIIKKDEQTEDKKDDQTEDKKDEQTEDKKDEQTDNKKDEQTEDKKDEQIDNKNEQTEDKKDEQTDNKKDEQTENKSQNKIQDNTISNKDYPKTGIEKVVLPIVILAIFSVGTYIGYRKYKEV